MKKTIFSFVASALVFASVPVFAGGGAVLEPPQHPWSFEGVTGKFDKQQLQRGFQVYKEVCSTCHALSKIAFRNLSDLGYSEDELKAIKSENCPRGMKDKKFTDEDMAMIDALGSEAQILKTVLCI